MLYMTTLSSHDTYTAHRALMENTTPDGGLYVPFQLPMLDAPALSDFSNKGCCETIAHILNLFFSSRLSAWDVQVCIGRNPIKVTNLGRKTMVADAWGNPGSSYDYAVASLNDRLAGKCNATVSSWTRIAIGIAFAFGIYAVLRQEGMLEHSTVFDICVPDGDMSQPMAMLYARKMGLPIGKIIVCSKENGAIWELVNHGQLNISQIPYSNRQPMQRLLNCELGRQCVSEYIAACDRRGVFCVLPEQQAVLSDHLFAAVISNERIESVAGSIGNSVADDTAICYAGIQDYRSKTGQGRQTLMIGYTAPIQNQQSAR